MILSMIFPVWPAAVASGFIIVNVMLVAIIVAKCFFLMGRKLRQGLPLKEKKLEALKKKTYAMKKKKCLIIDIESQLNT